VFYAFHKALKTEQARRTKAAATAPH